MTITDAPGDNFLVKFSLRGLEPNTAYLLVIKGGSSSTPTFQTDARGTYTTKDLGVDGAAFNMTNPITTTL